MGMVKAKDKREMKGEVLVSMVKAEDKTKMNPRTWKLASTMVEDIIGKRKEKGTGGMMMVRVGRRNTGRDMKETVGRMKTEEEDATKR
ncbi:hypothetical protein Bca101_021908 [Brassica carinata]